MKIGTFFWESRTQVVKKLYFTLCKRESVPFIINRQVGQFIAHIRTFTSLAEASTLEKDLSAIA